MATVSSQTSTLDAPSATLPVKKEQQRFVRRWLLSNQSLGLLLLASVPLALFIGAYRLSVEEVLASLGIGQAEISDSIRYLVLQIRLPRILLAIVVGAGLSVAGAAIQGLFRNALADPALIGVTSGAMVFAVAGIFFTGGLLSSLSGLLGYSTVAILGFLGSVLSTLLVYRLASHRGRTSVTTMLLAGIAITALAGALTGLMTYFSTEDELRDITFWTLGSLSGANWSMLLLVSSLIIIALIALLRCAPGLDLLMLGENEAFFLGASVQRLKWVVILSAALAVGTAVAVSGIISFVALVVPHLVRLSRGPAHRSLLMGSALLGAILLLWADTLARVAIAPAELPIGILTALLGAPFFIWLLRKNQLTSTLD